MDDIRSENRKSPPDPVDEKSEKAPAAAEFDIETIWAAAFKRFSETMPESIAAVDFPGFPPPGLRRNISLL